MSYGTILLDHEQSSGDCLLRRARHTGQVVDAWWDFSCKALLPERLLHFATPGTPDWASLACSYPP